MVVWIKDLLTNFYLNDFFAWIISFAALALVVFILAVIVDVITSKVLDHIVRRFLKILKANWYNSLAKFKFIKRISLLAPAIVVHLAAPMFNIESIKIGKSIEKIIKVGTHIYIISILLISLDSLLNAINDIYSKFEIAKKKPIKTYLQLIKLISYFVGVVIIISILLNKSPTGFFAGIGAMTAIIILVFKDSILGLVTSVQLATNDMVRIGDWITIPSIGVDGDVIEISLTTVKIRNFDKTVTTIPSYSLLSTGVTNWRGMKESGGRRIKRAIFIDLNSIKFCNQEMLDRFKNISCISNYVSETEASIKAENKGKRKLDKLAINGRQLSNVGVFRAYVNEYLKNHPNIHTNGYTFLVRQLQPTANGLPIELYIFTNDTIWANYERIQSDIFDHLLAALPIFDLKPFQNLSGEELKVLVRNI